MTAPATIGDFNAALWQNFVFEARGQSPETAGVSNWDTDRNRLPPVSLGGTVVQQRPRDGATAADSNEPSPGLRCRSGRDGDPGIDYGL